MTDGSLRPPSADEAIDLLVTLGAPPRLVRHHELVVEAATLLVDRLARLAPTLSFDRAAALVGAAWHDAGKIEFPAEMDEPGTRHEASGEALLLRAGVAPRLARFCRTHAQWTADVDVDDLLVSLADKLWKGKREERLEARLCDLVAKATGVTAWEAFASFDALCEDIARTADDRLARSRV
jgi:hypothetical protein